LQGSAATGLRGEIANFI